MHNKYFKMMSFMQLKIAEGTSAEYLQATGFTEFYENSKEKNAIFYTHILLQYV